MKDELQDDVRQLQEEIALLEAMEEQCPNSESLAENSAINTTTVMGGNSADGAELVEEHITSTTNVDAVEIVDEVKIPDHANMDTLNVDDVEAEDEAEVTEVRDTLDQENIETVDEGNVANQASIETVDLVNTIDDTELEQSNSNAKVVSKHKGQSPAKSNTDKDLNDMIGSQTVVEESDNDIFDTPLKEHEEKQSPGSTSKRSQHSQSAKTSLRKLSLSRSGKKSPLKNSNIPKKLSQTVAPPSSAHVKQSLSQPKTSTPQKKQREETPKSSQRSCDSSAKVIEETLIDDEPESNKKCSSQSSSKKDVFVEIPVREKEFSPIRSPTPPNSPPPLPSLETTETRPCMYSTKIVCLAPDLQTYIC